MAGDSSTSPGTHRERPPGGERRGDDDARTPASTSDVGGDAQDDVAKAEHSPDDSKAQRDLPRLPTPSERVAGEGKNDLEGVIRVPHDEDTGDAHPSTRSDGENAGGRARSRQYALSPPPPDAITDSASRSPRRVSDDGTASGSADTAAGSAETSESRGNSGSGASGYLADSGSNSAEYSNSNTNSSSRQANGGGGGDQGIAGLSLEDLRPDGAQQRRGDATMPPAGGGTNGASATALRRERERGSSAKAIRHEPLTSPALGGKQTPLEERSLSSVTSASSGGSRSEAGDHLSDEGEETPFEIADAANAPLAHTTAAGKHLPTEYQRLNDVDVPSSESSPEGDAAQQLGKRKQHYAPQSAVPSIMDAARRQRPTRWIPSGTTTVPALADQSSASGTSRPSRGGGPLSIGGKLAARRHSTQHHRQRLIVPSQQHLAPGPGSDIKPFDDEPSRVGHVLAGPAHARPLLTTAMDTSGSSSGAQDGGLRPLPSPMAHRRHRLGLLGIPISSSEDEMSETGKSRGRARRGTSLEARSAGSAARQLETPAQPTSAVKSSDEDIRMSDEAPVSTSREDSSGGDGTGSGELTGSSGDLTGGHSSGRQVSESSFRSIVDDLTIKNHVLKRKLAQYEAPSVPENLVREKLFEIKFFETMPAERRNEIELFLTRYVQSLGEAEQPSSSDEASRVKRSNEESAQASSSEERYTSSGREKTSSGGAATTLTIPGAESSSNPGKCVPIDEYATDRTLPRAPADAELAGPSQSGLEPRSLQGTGAGVRMPSSFNRESRTARAVRHREHDRMRDAVRREKHSDVLDSQASKARDIVDTLEQLFERSYEDNTRRREAHDGSSVEDGSNRAYLAHMVDNETENAGWHYLNLILTLGEIYRFNVTVGFVREAIRTFSTRLELSPDGGKLRWRTHTAHKPAPPTHRAHQHAAPSGKGTINDDESTTATEPSFDFSSAKLSSSAAATTIPSDSSRRKEKNEPTVQEQQAKLSQETSPVTSDMELDGQTARERMLGGNITFFKSGRFCSDLSADTRLRHSSESTTPNTSEDEKMQPPSLPQQSRIIGVHRHARSRSVKSVSDVTTSDVITSGQACSVASGSTLDFSVCDLTAGSESDDEDEDICIADNVSERSKRSTKALRLPTPAKLPTSGMTNVLPSDNFTLRVSMGFGDRRKQALGRLPEMAPNDAETVERPAKRQRLTITDAGHRRAFRCHVLAERAFHHAPERLQRTGPPPQTGDSSASDSSDDQGVVQMPARTRLGSGSSAPSGAGRKHWRRRIAQSLHSANSRARASASASDYPLSLGVPRFHWSPPQSEDPVPAQRSGNSGSDADAEDKAHKSNSTSFEDDSPIDLDEEVQV